MAFSGAGSSTGYSIALGSRPDAGQPAEGASPMELVLLGTAGCTAMDVLSILQKKRQHITAFEVRMHADRTAEHPKVFTHIRMEYVVTGNRVDPQAVQRAIELSLGKYCSVHAMLSKAVSIEHSYTIIEAEQTT